MRIAVLGVGNIGKFHVRDFIGAGCEVISILGQTQESSEAKAREIEAEFGIKVNPYHNLDELLKERLDAVSVCTPYKLHSEQVRKCLEKNLHVLCEKPFIADTLADNFGTAKELFSLALQKNKILGVNTQWPSIIPFLKEKLDFTAVKEFEMSMEPGLQRSGLLLDFLPHANSMLIALAGIGEIKNLQFARKSPLEYLLTFDYLSPLSSCKVTYRARYKESRPRQVSFKINQWIIERVIKDNEMFFKVGETKLNLPDPFRLSIQNFVNQVTENEPPLLSRDAILKNVELQDCVLRHL